MSATLMNTKRSWKIHWFYISLIVLILGASWGIARNTRPTHPGGDESAGMQRKILYYVDPMNPAHTSDKPGVAPCGMDMEPVYADGRGAGPGSSLEGLPPGTVRITPEKQQMIGIRLAQVKMSAYRHALRTLGQVTPDEKLTYRLTTGDYGWVWDAGDATTGSIVEKDQLVARVYYNQFLTRVEDYLRALEYDDRQKSYASRGADRKEAGGERPSASRLGAHRGEQDIMSRKPVPTSSFTNGPGTKYGGLNAAGRVLYNVKDQLVLATLELLELGVTDTQLQEIALSRELVSDVEIRSPVRGIVVRRSLSGQQRFDRGTELYRIADMSRVWVLADVYEDEAMYIRPGMHAGVTLPHQDKVFEAVVSDVPPVFDPDGRVFKVRLEMDNPDYILRPDMYVDVEIEVTFPPAVVVPADAVLDSGLEKTVFVDRGDGRFELRPVETGWRFKERIEIVKGLRPGERIAVSGNFFIDSESRMKPAAEGLYRAPQEDPHDGAAVSPIRAMENNMPMHMDGATPSLPAPAMNPAMEMPPGQTMAPDGGPPPEPAGGDIQKEKPDFFVDPVCGMPLAGDQARQSGLESIYHGRTFYFCSSICKDHFDAGPQAYLKAKAAPQAKPVVSTGAEAMDR